MMIIRMLACTRSGRVVRCRGLHGGIKTGFEFLEYVEKETVPYRVG